MLTCLLHITVELVVEVRFDVFAAVGKPWQAEAPEVDARKQIGAELLFAHFDGEIAVGSAYELKVAVFVFCRAQGTEGFLFDSL